MQNKLTALVGFAARARKTATGEVAVEQSIKKNKAFAVLAAQDASDGTKERYRRMAQSHGIPYYEAPAELCAWAGHPERRIMSIEDKGFCISITQYLEEINLGVTDSNE